MSLANLQVNVRFGAAFDLLRNIADGLNPLVSQTSLVDSLAYALADCNELYCQIRQLAAGQTETLDLSAGALLNPFGDTINFTNVKALVLQLLSATQDSTYGTAASHIHWDMTGVAHPFRGPIGAGSIVAVENSGAVFFATDRAAGWSVANGVNDQMKIRNGDGVNAAAYRLFIVGNNN